MHLVELRFLRGPNLYADQPRLRALIALAAFDAIRSNDPPGFAERLADALALDQSDADALQAGLPMAETVELVSRTLQGQAGVRIEVGLAEPVAGRSDRFRLVWGYPFESVGEMALRTALAAIAATARREDFDWEGRIAALRAGRGGAAFRCSNSTAAASSSAGAAGKSG